MKPYGLSLKKIPYEEFFLARSDGHKFIPNIIYMQALQLAQNSYIFSSYNVVNWLSSHNALTDPKVRWTTHVYTSRPNDDDLIFIRELDPDFELKNSYW